MCWVKRGFWSSEDVSSCWLDESDLLAVAAVRSKRWNQPSAPTATTKFCQTEQKNIHTLPPEYSWFTVADYLSFRNSPFLCCRRLRLRHRSAGETTNHEVSKTKPSRCEIMSVFRFLYWPCPHRFLWSRVWSRHFCTRAAFRWCPRQPARSTAVKWRWTAHELLYNMEQMWWVLQPILLKHCD